jgi:hypothetical protein
MKKTLIVLAIIIGIIAGGAWYMISNAGGFIKAQIEQQGSQYLGTTVSVFEVDLALTDGKLTINDLDVENPAGFSQEDAFSIQAMTLDLGDITGEPYTVQLVSVDAPEVLYEVDASGNGNLLVLNDNIQANLPKSSEAPAETGDTANPLVIVEDVRISNVRLKLNFEQLDTGDLNIEKKAYEVTLPTFSAGSIGKPNGIPADQVGAKIASVMLDNVIKAAKKEAKKRLKDEAKKKLDEEKDKLLDKASDKLKGLLN